MARQCSEEAQECTLLTVPSGDDARVPVNKYWIQRVYCDRVRRIRIREVFIVLLWALTVSASSNAVYGYINYCFIIVGKLHCHVQDIPVITLIAFSAPLAGWLADIKFGRHRVIQVSLWSMWIGITGFVIVHSYVSNVMAEKVLKPLCGVPICCGFAGFTANAIQFAIDQMPEASSEEVSAFIHWYVWTTFLGRTLSKAVILLSSCSKLSLGDNDKAFVLLFMLGMLTLSLSTGMLFRNTLTVIPESRNPMKTVIRVLRYSAVHKNQRAHTYTDSCIPSRLDLGKEIYGGPFTTEQVEDVKTFLRIIGIIFTTIAVVMPLNLCWKTMRTIADHFQRFIGESHYLKEVYELAYSQNVLIGLGIPLYELFIHPLTRRWVPKILRRNIIAAILIVFASIFLLILDSAGHYMRDAPCMFASSQAHNITLPINYLAVDVPLRFLMALIIMLYRIALFEFICAQSPYNMKGFLLGLGYFAIYFGEGIATSIQAWWYYGWKNQYGLTTPSCDFWYYLMVTIIAVLALVLVVLVVRHYQQREREEPNYNPMHVENYYERNSNFH